MTRFIKPAALSFVVGVAAYFLAKPAAGGPTAGSPAPEFRLADLSGRTASLSEYRGKVVLVEFWATWCTSCAQQLPNLKKAHETFPASDFAVLAVSVDTAAPDVVARYASEKGMPFRVLYADENTGDAYRVFGLPAMFLIARDGTIFRRYAVPPPPETLEADIRSALDSRRPA